MMFRDNQMLYVTIIYLLLITVLFSFTTVKVRTVKYCSTRWQQMVINTKKRERLRVVEEDVCVCLSLILAKISGW